MEGDTYEVSSQNDNNCIYNIFKYKVFIYLTKKKTKKEEIAILACQKKKNEKKKMK